MDEITKVDDFNATIITPVPDKVDNISIDQVLADMEQSKLDTVRFQGYLDDEAVHFKKLEVKLATLEKLGLKPTPVVEIPVIEEPIIIIPEPEEPEEPETEPIV